MNKSGSSLGHLLFSCSTSDEIEDLWWSLQTFWIQMRPHKMWGLIWEPNCLTLRLYISKKLDWNNENFAIFERKKMERKLYTCELPRTLLDLPFLCTVQGLWYLIYFDTSSLLYAKQWQKYPHNMNINYMEYNKPIEIRLFFHVYGKQWLVKENVL